MNLMLPTMSRTWTQSVNLIVKRWSGSSGSVDDVIVFAIFEATLGDFIPCGLL
jgi:hypothetical protein